MRTLLFYCGTQDAAIAFFNGDQQLMVLSPEETAHTFFYVHLSFFPQKPIELLEYVVRKYNKPPEGSSNLTGMLGGRSSECLMKMNGENCWYKSHVVGA